MGPLPKAWPKSPLTGTASIHPTLGFKTQDGSLLHRSALFLGLVPNKIPYSQLLTFELLNVSMLNKNGLYTFILKQKGMAKSKTLP